MFVYTSKSGDIEVTLAPFTTIPAGVFRKVRGLDNMQQMFACIEAAADEEALEAVDRLPIAELDALFEAWADGADVPKS